MKLTFSTLGCPGWSWNEIFATAKDLGMDGIEIRGVGAEMFAPKTSALCPENLDRTMAALKKAGLCIPMLTSNVQLARQDIKADMMDEARAYIDLAQKTETPYVRIMCENTPMPSGADIDMDAVAGMYREICDYAAGSGVSPLIETNGILADTEVMRSFIERTDRPNAFVLWDIHHPHRYFHEEPHRSAENLEGLVKYVHVKDSIMENGKTAYRMMGYGDVPVLDCLKILNARGYDGFVSLEWVKRWSPDLQEPGIVFSHYANYMQYLIRQL